MTVTQVLKVLRADTIAGVEQLHRRGVSPTLGVLVTANSKVHLDSFQDLLRQSAGAAGLALRHLDLTADVAEETALPPDIRSQLDSLQAIWEWSPPAEDRDGVAIGAQLMQLFDGVGALRDFEALYNASTALPQRRSAGRLPSRRLAAPPAGRLPLRAAEAAGRRRRCARCHLPAAAAARAGSPRPRRAHTARQGR